MWIGSLEFPHHVVVGVQAIVNEDPYLSKVREQAGKNITSVAKMKMSRVTKPLRNKPARFFPSRKKRSISQANRV